MTAKKSTPPVLLVGGGADDPDVRRLTGFTAPDPFLCLRHRGDLVVLVSGLELGRALRVKPKLVCLTPADLALPKKQARDPGAQAAALLRHRRLSTVRVSAACPVGIVRRLERAGINVHVLSRPPVPEREFKRAPELRHLRSAQRAAVAAMKEATALIARSEPDASGFLRAHGEALTSERVREVIEISLLKDNCRAEDIIVAGGDQAVDPHERGHGPLRAGEAVVIDIFPRHASGYWGDITRTVAKGPVSRERRHLYNAVLTAQKAALSMVRPGTSGADIHRRVREIFEQLGYETGMREGIPQGFIHSTGHGVGLEIHEAPSISPAGSPLQTGQVVTIEPGLYYRGLGGVRVEDTVVVTETGHSLLGRCAKRFVL